MNSEPRFTIEPSPKRIRAIVGKETIADSIATMLLVEGYSPVYYFPNEDVRTDLLRPAAKHSNDPGRGDAAWWSIAIGGDVRENCAWSYPDPEQGATTIARRLAFEWDKIDQWFEEDEEIFGHPRDPHHRVDVRPSGRLVTVAFAGETIASTRRGLFLFETGLPPRYYIPPQDVRIDRLAASPTTSICPYKGTASYWHLRAGALGAEDAVWSYLDPLPECPRIKGYFCFYPEKVDRLEIEPPTSLAPAAAT